MVDVSLARVEAFTAAHTMLLAESGHTFTNDGAAGTVLITLSADNTIGQMIRLVTADADTFQVVANTGDSITCKGTTQTPANGFQSGGTEGEFIELVLVTATEWFCFGESDSWGTF